MLPQMGDFIAIAILAGKVFQALSSSRGSKYEYISLCNTLKALSQAMLQAEALCMEYPAHVLYGTCKDQHRLHVLDTVAGDIRDEKEACEALIQDFLKQTESYTYAFMAEGTSRLRQEIKKLTWIGRAQQAEALDKALRGHLQAMQMHLGRFYHVTMKGEMADNRALLQSVDSSIGVLTGDFGDMRTKFSEMLSKLDAVQNRMPTGLGYFWESEPPVLLLDALGRKTPLPVMLVGSPEVFRDILLIMHRGCHGYDKVQNGKYVVSDEDFGGALVPREKWHHSFQPGRRIAVSFLLKYPEGGSEVRCPKCGVSKTCLDINPGQRRCLKCHLVYKIDDKQQTRPYWRDLKKRPKAPPQQEARSPAAGSKKQNEKHKDGSPRRSEAPHPEEHAHPFSRVHYVRTTPCRNTVEPRWHQSHPEFEGFLAALPPLHRAAATGDVEKLDELLEDDVNVDMPWENPDSKYRHDRTGWDFIGAPPIHFAAYFRQNQAVLFLLSRGAEIDAKDAAGTTALHAAAWTGHQRLFQMLLKKGADRAICDSDGWSAATYAMIQGHDDIARLLQKGEDGDEEGLVETYTLRLAAKLGNMDTVLKMLLESQASTEDSDTSGILFTEALVGAAEGGNVELVSRLLEKGADPSKQDQAGSTALHWAAWGGHTEIGNLMYDGDGATNHSEDSQDGDDDGGAGVGAGVGAGAGAGAGTAKPDLRSQGHESVIKMLIQGGADVNAQNCQGCTPLHWVSGAGSVAMIQCLLDHGARVDVEDNSGRTPVDRAKETDDDNVLRQLQRE